jgi:hypothetical protein
MTPLPAAKKCVYTRNNSMVVLVILQLQIFCLCLYSKEPGLAQLQTEMFTKLSGPKGVIKKKFRNAHLALLQIPYVQAAFTDQFKIKVM